MAEEKTKKTNKTDTEAERAARATTRNIDNVGSASSTPATPSNPDAPTAEDDRRQLEEQLTPDIGRKVDIEVNPPEVQENGADWFEGREPNDVVEVEGQRETVEAREARNGVNAPEKQAGATTKPTA